MPYRRRYARRSYRPKRRYSAGFRSRRPYYGFNKARTGKRTMLYATAARMMKQFIAQGKA